MGRNNRSRKRHDAMNRVKRERNAAKELQRLKRTLGILDAEGNEVMKDLSSIAEVKTAKQIKQERKIKENQMYQEELEEQAAKGEKVTFINEKGVKHTYNTKTMKDQNGSYPSWFKSKKGARRKRRLSHARKKSFKQAWTVINVPL